MCHKPPINCLADTPNTFQPPSNRRTLLVAVGLLTLLPTSCYLNRGFTVWFHWASVVCWLSASVGGNVERLRCGLWLLGTSVCAGWYASVWTDCLLFGRPCMRLLYQNMPQILSQFIFDPNGEMMYDKRALMAMTGCHAIDLIGHPFVTYLHWYPLRRGGKRLGETSLTWPVIVGVYVFSRIWSFVHNYYNFRTVDPFYTGFDIYNVDDAQQWIPAYVAETICLGGVALSTFLHSRGKQCAGRNLNLETKPSLLYSESTLSVQSDKGKGERQRFLAVNKKEKWK